MGYRDDQLQRAGARKLVGRQDVGAIRRRRRQDLGAPCDRDRDACVDDGLVAGISIEEQRQPARAQDSYKLIGVGVKRQAGRPGSRHRSGGGAMVVALMGSGGNRQEGGERQRRDKAARDAAA